MNLDHTPHPTIEDHPYIRELIAGQEKRATDRTHHQNRVKDLEDREKFVIGDAKMVVMTDFHCLKCATDFKQIAVLNVEIDWSNPAQRIAFYRGVHKKCGTRAVRLVTDKHKDGFWVRSRAIASDRGKYYKDLIQPHETGFNLLYGKR